MTTVDAFTKLIEIIMKSLVSSEKLKLDKVFECIFIVLTKYHEMDGDEFN